jgi:hypothetical protein
MTPPVRRKPTKADKLYILCAFGRRYGEPTATLFGIEDLLNMRPLQQVLLEVFGCTTLSTVREKHFRTILAWKAELIVDISKAVARAGNKWPMV